MTPFEAVIALLHVSALVGAISAAYARLDTGGAGKKPEKEIFKVATEIAATIINSLGISASVPDLMDLGNFGRVKIVYPAAAIFVVAKNRTPLDKLHTFMHWFYCGIRIRVFQHYRNRGDIAFAGVIASASFFIFFLIAQCIIWADDWIEDRSFLEFLFVIQAGFFGFIIFQAVGSWGDPEEGVISVCHHLENEVKVQLEILNSGQAPDLRRFRGELERPRRKQEENKFTPGDTT